MKCDPCTQGCYMVSAVNRFIFSHMSPHYYLKWPYLSITTWLCQKGIQICSLLYLGDYRKINLTLYLEFCRSKLSKILCGKNSFHASTSICWQICLYHYQARISAWEIICVNRQEVEFPLAYTWGTETLKVEKFKKKVSKLKNNLYTGIHLI